MEAKKWQDTVMSPEQMSNIRYEALKEALKATDIASAQCGKERGSGFFGFSGFSDEENREYFDKTYLKEALERIAQAQAEISFKAGYDKAVKDAVEPIEKAFSGGKKAGIKEVVEWFKLRIITRGHYEGYDKVPEDVSFMFIPYEEWQAKLKEWEVE